MATTWGDVAKQAEVKPNLLPANEGRNKPRFHLIISKDNWVWDPACSEYLPALTKMHLSPGVNGIGETDGHIDASAAIQREVSRGRMVLFDGDPRLKIPNDPSARLRDGRFRGEVLAATSKAGTARRCYIWAWDGYQADHGRVEWVEDAKMRQRFQRHLIAVNLIPAMPYTLRAMLYRDAQRRLQTMENRRAITGQGQARLARMREYVEALRVDLEAHATEEDLKPYAVDDSADDVVVVDGKRMIIEEAA